jgi:hypothetical protein
MARQDIQRPDDDVVERGAAPRAEPLHCPGARGGVRFAPGQREHRIVECDQRDLVFRAERFHERSHGLLHIAHRIGHAAAHVDGEYQFQGRARRLETGDSLRRTIVQDAELVAGEALDEMSAGIGDHGVDLHDLDGDRLGIAERFRPYVLHDALTIPQARDDANQVLFDC